MQFDYILMSRVQDFSQVAERCYLAAEQVPGDLVINGLEVDDLDGNAIEGAVALKAQVYVSGWALTQKNGIIDAVGFVDGSYLPRLHLL